LILQADQKKPATVPIAPIAGFIGPIDRALSQFSEKEGGSGSKFPQIAKSGTRRLASSDQGLEVQSKS
jgi:hypothetical protein